MPRRSNNLADQFGPLVPSRLPTRDTLIKNIGRLRDEFERLRDDTHAPNRQSEIRAVQMGIRSLLRDLQRFPVDHERLAVELSALLNYRPASPDRADHRAKPTISLQENLNAIGYEE